MDDRSWGRAGFVLSLLATGLLAGAAFVRVQYATPFLPEYDGYYHIKMAQLVCENGFLGAFPWLPLTTFSQRFSDMHLVFHYLLVPFTFLGLTPGAKLYAVLSAVLAVLVFFAVLRRERVPWPVFWVLVLLSSASFRWRERNWFQSCRGSWERSRLTRMPLPTAQGPQRCRVRVGPPGTGSSTRTLAGR